VDAARDVATDARVLDAPSCVDEDMDGHLARFCGGDDCDDANALIYPGAPPRCSRQSSDCSGTPDISRVSQGELNAWCGRISRTNLPFVCVTSSVRTCDGGSPYTTCRYCPADAGCGRGACGCIGSAGGSVTECSAE
jgi:hypothetical protein